MTARYSLARAAGAATAGLSRLTGRGSGTHVGGRVTLLLDPGALAHAAAGRELALVSGTNGKTTTRTLLVAALQTVQPVVSNGGGANLPPGLTLALAADPRSRIGVLEVDEPFLPRVAAAVHPRAVVLLNLSRDQLDRYAEVRRLAGIWRDAVSGPAPPYVVANADDPLVDVGGLRRHRRRMGRGRPALDLRLDVLPRLRRGPRPRRRRPRLELPGLRPGPADPGLDGHGPDGADPGRDVVRRGAGHPRRHQRRQRRPRRGRRGAVGSAAGRRVRGDARHPVGGGPLPADGVRAGGRCGCSWRRTRPAGSRRSACPGPDVPAVVSVNARAADGRDPSWLWDVPFELLRGRFAVATGERSRDVAVRLRYAGVDHTRVDDPADALRAAPGDGPVEVLANYTAFQVYRRVVGDG